MRLRLEQQRLFAWSETSGLLDYDADNNTKVLESNAFGLHRSTVLELLVQIKVLFEDFEKHQKRHKGLETTSEQQDVLASPTTNEKADEVDSGKDSLDALVPLPPKRKAFIDKALRVWKATTNEGPKRLRWAAFDKDAFEGLLQRFSALNDSITDLLDMRLRDEIYSVTQDTNRGVLQLTHDLADLQQLVKATLVLTLQSKSVSPPPPYQPSESMAKNNVTGMELLGQLARFKAFNEFIELESPLNLTGSTTDLLQLRDSAAEKLSMKIEKSSIHIPHTKSAAGEEENRCEAMYKRPDGTVQQVWIEWKDYDWETPGNPCPAPLVIERAQKLAALLHHRAKPAPFRVPHCLGYFDNADHSYDDEEDRRSSRSYSPTDEENECRIGFVFEKPESVLPSSPPISLHSLLCNSRKPRVTDRIALATAVANCILYLHSVNWLHKGLRSNNIVFFRCEKTKKIEFSKPYISGFDFARPERLRPDEETEIPVDSLEYNLYRHPNTQDTNLGLRETYRKSFDVYSLGVVLVEVAHWMPIDQVLEIDLTASKNKPKISLAVREKLLDPEMVEAVGANMGEVYEQAVRRCLIGGTELGIEKGKDETKDGTVAANLSMVFYEEVVKKLEEVRV